MLAQGRERQEGMSADDVIGMLISGNHDFVREGHGKVIRIKQMGRTRQFPIAAVLTCVDSRFEAVSVFGMEPGDLAVQRTPGNTASAGVISALSFICEGLGTKLIVVLGHSGCGAVAAARNPGTLSELSLGALKHVHTCDGDPYCSEAFNVKRTVVTLKEHLPGVTVAGAHLDLKTGRVHFLQV